MRSTKSARSLASASAAFVIGSGLAGPALAQVTSAASQTPRLITTPQPAPRNYVGASSHPPFQAPPIWAGLSLGLHGTFADQGLRFDGLGNGDTGLWRGGASLGWMGQTGSFVYGVEADIESGGGATTIAGLGSADVGASATVRGKAGIALGQWLPYLTAGIALAKPELRLDGVGSTDEWRTGFAYGAGLAWRATPNLSLKGEVLRVDYGDIGIGATRIHLDETRVRAGITWHFN